MNEIVTNITWPPPYKVRKHKRARHVKLRAVRPHGLLVTIPYRFSVKEIPSILEEHKSWILKHLSQLPNENDIELPDTIVLTAVQKTWSITYIQTTNKLKLIEVANMLKMVGRIEEKEACKRLLVQWLKLKAKLYLAEMINEVSKQTTLSYANLRIRDQKTLWGSCTSRKNISLNYKLILLPTHLARHIIIHELCHTKHANHSERFWGLVAEHDNDWASNRRQMRKADAYIPGWI